MPQQVSHSVNVADAFLVLKQQKWGHCSRPHQHTCNTPAHLTAAQDVCNQTWVVDAVYGAWGYKVLRAPAPRVRTTEEAFVNINDKFEIGNPASATLRAPKANTARGTHNAASGLHPLPSTGLVSLLCLVTAWMALTF